MPRYKSLTGKKHAERIYPWRVDIEVQSFRLGSRLTDMHEWCWERGSDRDQHGHQKSRPGEIAQEVARF